MAKRSRHVGKIRRPAKTDPRRHKPKPGVSQELEIFQSAVTRLKKKGQLPKSYSIPKRAFNELSLFLQRCALTPAKMNAENLEIKLHDMQRRKLLESKHANLIRIVFSKMAKDFSRGGKHASD